MADISPARSNILTEETQYRAAVSEALLTKTGASINFINLKQYDQRSFQLNGSYALGVGQLGADQIIPLLFDCEIVGFSYWNGGTGTSGSSIFDIHRLTGGDTDAGTIFSTKPEFDSTAANNTYTVRDVLNSTTVALPTGHTLAVLSTTQFDAGDALRLDIDAAMPGASNAGVYIFIRPR